MLRILAVISTLMTLPVFCFGQTGPSPVPAYHPGNQYPQRQMMPANFGRYANPMAQAVAQDVAPAAPMASPMPVPSAMPPAGNTGVSDSFSDMGTMAAPMDSYGVTDGSYFDAGSCSSGDCGSSVVDAGCCDTNACCGGNYMSIFGGMADLDRQRSAGLDRDLEVQFGQGYALGGAMGRRVGRYFRTELEYCFRSQDPGNVRFNDNSYQNLSGNQNSHAGMFNVIFDMIIGHGNLVPYIGGGVGVGFIDSSVEFGPGQLDGDDTALAYQWMAGLSYRAKPNMELFVEYRIFEINKPKLNYFGAPTVDNRTPNLLLNSEYQSNDVFAGFRFNF